jgi:hypothetical protein
MKMDQELLYNCAATLSEIMTIALILKKKKPIWVKVWIGRRDMKQTHQSLLKELQCEDMKYYIKYSRLDDDTFQFIVSKVSRFIAKESTQPYKHGNSPYANTSVSGYCRKFFKLAVQYPDTSMQYFKYNS